MCKVVGKETILQFTGDDHAFLILNEGDLVYYTHGRKFGRGQGIVMKPVRLGVLRLRVTEDSEEMPVMILTERNAFLERQEVHTHYGRHD
ncbi:MAG: hypothetical protein LPK08_02460 [Halomonas sp.]|nr:hypothetical protein [Halomonas sp.]